MLTKMPQRSSLVSQTALIMRNELRGRIWTRYLPSEQELCARFQVSRTTLRLALAQLEREGLLKGGQGRRRQIVAQQSASLSSRSRKQKLVILLSPRPLSAMNAFALFWIDELRNQLARAGYHLEIQSNPKCYGARPGRVLENLASRLKPAGWVLHLSSVSMQRWFSEHGIPVVISGSRHSGVAALSVDFNHRATCRHAALRLLMKGKRRLMFVVPHAGLAGDLESEVGFKDGAQSLPGVSTECRILYHDGSAAGLRAKLAGVWNEPSVPDGILVANSTHVLTVLGDIQQRGMKVPHDVALISRDDDPYLKFVVPTVSRYVVNPALYARKVTRAVISVVQGSGAKSSDIRLTPRFVPGESLA